MNATKRKEIICRRGEERREGEEVWHSEGLPELQKQLMLEAGPGPGFINPPGKALSPGLVPAPKTLECQVAPQV